MDFTASCTLLLVNGVVGFADGHACWCRSWVGVVSTTCGGVFFMSAGRCLIVGVEIKIEIIK